MDNKDLAYQDYLNGMKYKDIAEKYEVSLSAVKSWATRYWKKEKVATSKNKKLQPQKVATKRKRGGQPGNKNGVEGMKNNKNALKHGAYSTVYWDSIDEDEKQMIESLNADEEFQLIEQLKLYAVRERRILKAIAKVKAEASKSGNIEVASSVGMRFEEKKSYVASVDENIEEKSTSAPKPSWSNKAIEKVDFAIMRMERELTSVQRNKTHTIKALIELHSQNGETADDWLESFITSLEEGENE